MNILILGGTGAMGTYLVPILSEKGHNVYITSRVQHSSERPNVHYILGNAHDMTFINEILKKQFDAIVDFMVYTTSEFNMRRDIFLNSTRQYVFLSSSRVYAESKEPLVENSPRLLEACSETSFLQTDEYALAKARQENLLRGGDKTTSKNWTIIRPYITYSCSRFQLGVYEKEAWLYRAIHGHTVVFPRNMASRITTLTHGRDVAQGIAHLIGNDFALGKTVHIASDESMTWGEIIRIYQDIFETNVGRPLKIYWMESENEMMQITNKYQVLYDRMYNRIFDPTQIVSLSSNKMKFTDVRTGLRECFQEFLKKPYFLRISSHTQAWMDRKTNERISLTAFPFLKDKAKYLMFRYMPSNIFNKLF